MSTSSPPPNGAPQPGNLLVPANGQMQPAPSRNVVEPLPTDRGTSSSPAIATKPNLKSLLIALQRRWKTGTCLAVVFAAIAGTIAWSLAPTAKYRAEGQVRVASKQPTILALQNIGSGDVQSFQKNQLARITSQRVLNMALNNETLKIPSLSVVQTAVAPVSWLKTELEVDFKRGPEILSLALEGDDPREIELLVNAIIEAYLAEFNHAEREELELQKKALANLQTEREKELKRSKTKLLGTASKTGKKSDEFQGDIVLSARQDLLQITLQEVQVNADISGFERKITQIAAGEQTVEMQNDLKLMEASDKGIAVRKNRITALEAEVEKWKERAGAENQTLKDRVASLKVAETDLDEYQKKRVKELQASLQNIHLSSTREQLAKAKEALGLLGDRRKQLEDVINGFKKDVKGEDINSIEVVLAQGEVDHVQAILKAVDAEIREVDGKLIALGSKPRAEVLDKAIVVETGSQVKRLLYAGFSSVAAALMALLGLSYWEFRSRRIHYAEEVVHALGIHLVGALPPISSRIRPKPKNKDSEGYVSDQRRLTEAVDSYRTLLLNAPRTGSARVLMVTSSMPGEGKTSLACHLALSLARTGRKTLLIDGDMRKPLAHQLLSMSRGPGLSDLLTDQASLEEVVRPSLVPGLSMITAGELNFQAIEALPQVALGDIFNQLKSQFDMIIVDSCPIVPVADSLTIGQHVDGVLFSILRDVSRMPHVNAAYQRLIMLGIPILGAVITGTNEDPYSSSHVYPVVSTS